MSRLVDDLSSVTFINSSKLERLVKLSLYCITEELLESILQEKTVTDYDIGIGRICISTADNQLKYKFIPSDDFNAAVKSTIKTKRNLLEAKVEKSLVSSIEETYKDLL